MAFLSRTQLFAAVLFFCLLSQIAGHSYMTKPTSRSNQAQSQTGCRGPACLGPCDIPLSKATRAPIVAARGDSITVEWPRNNHAGGFIRFAWAPTSQSDNHAAFDSNVQQINCHEIGNPTAGQCAPADPINDPNGGGSGPGDGSSGACNVAIKVPLNLADGKWTLQWAWFGGAFSLGDYFSCTDYQIAGGPTGSMTPVFIGGDFSYPGQQKCKFFNTDKLHVCTNEPCQAPIYPASQMQSGPPAAGQLGANIPIVGPVSTIPVTTPAPAPVSAPAPAPVSAPVPTPSPPTRVTTAASSRPASTTGAKSSTTGVKSTPPVSTPVTPSPSGNCAAASVASTSTASITSIDVWGTAFHAAINIDVKEDILSNWVLEVKLPSQGSPVKITSFFNGGLFQCQDSNTAYFAPVAHWANDLTSGSKVTVEFIATNSGLDAQFIQSNMQIRVLKH